MRHKDTTKVLKRGLKYEKKKKNTNKITIYRFKSVVASLLNVSTRTLDRGIPFENDSYKVYLIANVVF